MRHRTTRFELNEIRQKAEGVRSAAEDFAAIRGRSISKFIGAFALLAATGMIVYHAGGFPAVQEQGVQAPAAIGERAGAAEPQTATKYELGNDGSTAGIQEDVRVSYVTDNQERNQLEDEINTLNEMLGD